MLDLLAVAGFAYAVSRLGHLDPMRALAETWGPLRKLVACPFCVGFWASMALDTSRIEPDLMMAAGIAGIALAPFVVLALRWGRRVVWPAAQLGALLGVLGSGVILALAAGESPTALVFGAFPGAIVALGVATVIDAGMAFTAKRESDHNWV